MGGAEAAGELVDVVALVGNRLSDRGVRQLLAQEVPLAPRQIQPAEGFGFAQDRAWGFAHAPAASVKSMWPSGMWSFQK